MISLARPEDDAPQERFYRPPQKAWPIALSAPLEDIEDRVSDLVFRVCEIGKDQDHPIDCVHINKVQGARDRTVVEIYRPTGTIPSLNALIRAEGKCDVYVNSVGGKVDIIIDPTRTMSERSAHRPDVLAYTKIDPEQAMNNIVKLVGHGQIDAVVTHTGPLLPQGQRSALLEDAKPLVDPEQGLTGVYRQLDRYAAEQVPQIQGSVCNVVLCPVDFKVDQDRKNVVRGAGNVGVVVAHNV